MQDRYHIFFGKRRTTISMDNILSELMAFRLGEQPGTKEAHRAVRLWLQDTLPNKVGTGRGRRDASQWARRCLIECVADKKLSAKRNDWIADRA